MKTSITPVSGKFGAPMGRRTYPQGYDDTQRVYLRRVRLCSGGYASGGAYWGIGAPLWEALQDDFTYYLRAPSREAAKRRMREEFHDEMKFYR